MIIYFILYLRIMNLIYYFKLIKDIISIPPKDDETKVPEHNIMPLFPSRRESLPNNAKNKYFLVTLTFQLQFSFVSFAMFIKDLIPLGNYFIISLSKRSGITKKLLDYYYLPHFGCINFLFIGFNFYPTNQTL